MKEQREYVKWRSLLRNNKVERVGRRAWETIRFYPKCSCCVILCDRRTSPRQRGMSFKYLPRELPHRNAIPRHGRVTSHFPSSPKPIRDIWSKRPTFSSHPSIAFPYTSIYTQTSRDHDPKSYSEIKSNRAPIKDSNSPKAEQSMIWPSRQYRELGGW